MLNGTIHDFNGHFPVRYVCFPRGFSYGTPIENDGFLWFSNGFPIENGGFPMVFLWITYGIQPLHQFHPTP